MAYIALQLSFFQIGYLKMSLYELFFVMSYSLDYGILRNTLYLQNN